MDILPTDIKKNHNKNLSPRELSRLLSIICLYTLKYRGQNKVDVMKAVIQDRLWQIELQEVKLPNLDELFLITLIDGVLENQEKLNNIIAQHITSKKILLDKLDLLILTILQCGCFEITHSDLKINVILYQYTFLTDCFFSKNEIAMVNAILHAIAKSFRKEP
ncbi:transcription antitermination protein NusB [Candidatus Hepatincolaceae symbiont of Richtersius coronifer]